jgi:hypothetical protein
MSRIRKNGTVRSCKGKETKECLCCHEIKDVIKFSTYYYCPKKYDNPTEEKIRRRLNLCKDCVKTRKENKKESVKKSGGDISSSSSGSECVISSDDSNSSSCIVDGVDQMR